MDPQTSPAADRLTLAERIVVVLDALLGGGLFVLVVLLLVLGMQGRADPNDPHGGTFQLLGAIVLSPLSLLFGLAAVAVAWRWRLRWVLQALAVLAVLVLAGGGLGRL